MLPWKSPSVSTKFSRAGTPQTRRASFPILAFAQLGASKTSACIFFTSQAWSVQPDPSDLDVFRKKMDFPDLKRTVQDLARLHHANIVLVEEKASGISLLQQLLNDGFLIVQAAPALRGAKTMRLRGQTPKIAGGFVLLPTQAARVVTY